MSTFMLFLSCFLLPFILDKVLRTTKKHYIKPQFNESNCVHFNSQLKSENINEKDKGNESAGWGNWLWVRPIWPLSNWVMCNHACTHAHVVPPLYMVSLSSSPTYSAVWLTQTSHPKILTYYLQISRELQRDVPNVHYIVISHQDLIYFPLCTESFPKKQEHM